VQAMLPEGRVPRGRHRMEGLFAVVDSTYDYSYDGVKQLLKDIEPLPNVINIVGKI
jgi:hypothetical protein